MFRMQEDEVYVKQKVLECAGGGNFDQGEQRLVPSNTAYKVQSVVRVQHA